MQLHGKTECESLPVQEASSERKTSKPEAIFNLKRTIEIENNAGELTPQRRNIMETHQINIFAFAMLGYLEQVENAQKP